MFAVDNTNLLYIILSSHLSSFVIYKANFLFFNSISFIFVLFIAILETPPLKYIALRLFLLRRLRAALAMCPVLGVSTGVSSTKGAKENVPALAAEIVTVCYLIWQLRVEDCLCGCGSASWKLDWRRDAGRRASCGRCRRSSYWYNAACIIQ